MYISRINLENYRNYTGESFCFSDGRNIIYGDNAQGKTNLLEAINYLTGARSFRGVKDGDLIKRDAAYSRISAEIITQDRKIEISADLFNDRRKQLFINGVKLKTAGELSGRFCTVLFSPDDLYLVRDGAAVRRKFMDLAFSQLRPRYLASIVRYNKLHEHKTRILKDYRENPSLIDTLDTFNEQIAAMGAVIIGYRAKFLKIISENAEKLHREISGNREELKVKYRTVSTVTDPFLSEEEIYRRILEHMRTHRQAELASGQALSGPHKDDMEVLIDGVPAKIYASQGQTRTAALSLKLAERELFRHERGDYPVLLLDDVLSEFDEVRREYVLNKLSSGQVIISLCDRKDMNGYEGKAFRIVNGAVQK